MAGMIRDVNQNDSRIARLLVTVHFRINFPYHANKVESQYQKQNMARAPATAIRSPLLYHRTPPITSQFIIHFHYTIHFPDWTMKIHLHIRGDCLWSGHICIHGMTVFSRDTLPTGWLYLTGTQMYPRDDCLWSGHSCIHGMTVFGQDTAVSTRWLSHAKMTAWHSHDWKEHCVSGFLSNAIIIML